MVKMNEKWKDREILGSAISFEVSGFGMVHKGISHSTNTLGKGMNPNILPPAMGK